jgi:hypothetical protein
MNPEASEYTQIPHITEITANAKKRFLSQDGFVSDSGIDRYGIYDAVSDEIEHIVGSGVSIEQLMFRLTQQTTATPEDLVVFHDGTTPTDWTTLYKDISEDIVCYEVYTNNPELKAIEESRDNS